MRICSKQRTTVTWKPLLRCSGCTTPVRPVSGERKTPCRLSWLSDLKSLVLVMDGAVTSELPSGCWTCMMTLFLIKEEKHPSCSPAITTTTSRKYLQGDLHKSWKCQPEVWTAADLTTAELGSRNMS